MPTASQAFENLTLISNAALAVAVAWHMVSAGLAVGLAAGWRPPRAWIGAGLSLPFLTVSALAWNFGNPFNGTVFLLVALLLAGLALRLDRRPVSMAPAWIRGIGIALIAFGWVYPHFVRVGNPLEYLYAAPLGLAPCPTLAMAIGFALIFEGLGSASWPLVLACAGIGYGLLGWFWLGVKLDGALIVGALALSWVGVRPFPRRYSGPAASGSGTTMSGDSRAGVPAPPRRK